MDINNNEFDVNGQIIKIDVDSLIFELDERSRQLSETSDSDTQNKLIDEIKIIHKKLNRIRARTNN